MYPLSLDRASTRDEFSPVVRLADAGVGRVEQLALELPANPMKLTVANLTMAVELCGQQLDEFNSLMGQQRTAELHDAGDLRVA
jgi:hypothetical protein